MLDRGAAAVTLQDNADQPLYDLDRAATPLWTQTSVSGLFPASTDTAALWLSAPDTILDNARHRVEILEDKDWEREWMQHYQPLQFAPGLWICPSWHSPPDPSAVNILLDPGLAFGTGTHPTTAMCLRALAELPALPRHVIDYGCGSGILAIAALLLGTESALGIDTDPQALVATRNNADRNGIAAPRLRVSLPGTDRPRAELVVANILAGPLCELADTICQHLSSQGELLLSGILSEQVPALQAAYSDHITLSVLHEQDGWVALYGRRHE